MIYIGKQIRESRSTKKKLKSQAIYYKPNNSRNYCQINIRGSKHTPDNIYHDILLRDILESGCVEYDKYNKKINIIKNMLDNYYETR